MEKSIIKVSPFSRGFHAEKVLASHIWDARSVYSKGLKRVYGDDSVAKEACFQVCSVELILYGKGWKRVTREVSSSETLAELTTRCYATVASKSSFDQA